MRSPHRLYGRGGELAIIQGLLTRLLQGDGGALVLAAPPGLGRTALLREAAAAHRSRGPVLYGTASAAGTGAAAATASADRAGPVPVPEPHTSEPLTPEELLVRLRGESTGRPVLVCADDVHVWDPASRTALAAAARRLGPGSGVGILIAADDGPAFAGLPTRRLGPLDEDASAALLDRLAGAGAGAGAGATTGPLDPVVRAELLREAAGNPRLLAGLLGHLTPGQLTGRAPLPCPLPGAERVLEAYAYRLDTLPAPARALLLLAAAAQEHEPVGAGADALLLLRAGTRAGLPRDFLDDALFGPAATEGLLRRAGSRVHFSPPLAARAVLHHTPPARRRAAHELLAALLGEAGDRAGTLAALAQRACAAPGPDHALAARLEAVATTPYSHAERSSTLARAAALTPDPPLRSARFAAAAEQAAHAGDPDRARALLARTAAPAGTGSGHGPAPLAGGPGLAPTSTGCSPCARAPPSTGTKLSWPPPRCSVRTIPAGPSTRCSGPPMPPGCGGRGRVPGGHGARRPRPVRRRLRLLPGGHVRRARRADRRGPRAAPALPRPGRDRRGPFPPPPVHRPGRDIRPRRSPAGRSRRARSRGGGRRLPYRGAGARGRTGQGA